MRFLTLLALGLLLPLPALIAQPQQLRGTVRDNVNQRGLPGAVVLLIDSAGRTLHRNITDGAGRYAVRFAPGARHLRVQRIGFRPHNVPISARVLDAATLDVSLVSLPRFLERREVVASSCRRRSDAGTAFALLEQAREGLLAMVVAREENPAALTRLAFERRLDENDRVERQQVRIDSTDRSSRSYESTYSAADFAEHGFLESDAGGSTMHAPDADVLLDDRFVAAYCFRLARADRARPHQMGLRFEPARSRRGRVDIEGTLWVDTLQRAIREIEFEYVGLDSRVQRRNPGGRVSFREMPNGMVLVDRWQLRLIGYTLIPSADTVQIGAKPREPFIEFHVKENGGEVAFARWDDGGSWRAPLGAVHLAATTAEGTPAAGVRLRLEGTDYAGTTDSLGGLLLPNLLPGPYHVVVEDDRLQAIGLDIPTTARFEAVRDSTAQFTMTAPTAAEYVSSRCGPGRRWVEGKPIPFIVGRIVTSDGVPLGGRPQVNAAYQLVTEKWVLVKAFFRPGTDGLFFICSDQLRLKSRVGLELVREGHEDNHMLVVLESLLTVVLFPVPE